MISKKVCMVGAFAVGKTSLVRQYVDSIFSEKYQTTIGVKIDKKQVLLDDSQIQMMIWDIEGVDIFTDLNPTYLRGASGVLLVIDGTRLNTMATAHEIISIIHENLEQPKILLAVNKSDLRSQWAVSEEELIKLTNDEKNIVYTSAKTGEGVEQAFTQLAGLITQPVMVE